ncbi:MAG: hypothetical protein ACJASI_001386 [Glaciecola sp.]|jgi:hypothetical protein
MEISTSEICITYKEEYITWGIETKKALAIKLELVILYF